MVILIYFHWSSLALLGSGCFTTHCHQQEHQGNISMLLCAALLHGDHLQPCMTASILQKWNPLKLMCGCLCRRVIDNCHACNPLTLWNAFVIAYNMLGDPRSVLLGLQQQQQQQFFLILIDITYYCWGVSGASWQLADCLICERKIWTRCLCTCLTWVFYYLYTYPVMNAGIQFHASILVTCAVMCHAAWKFDMGQLPAQACLWSWHIFTSALQNLCYACNKCLILPSCWSTINIVWTRSLS